MGVPPTDVFAAWFKTQQGDYVVVGDSLVDRRTGKVIFQDPSSGGGSAVEVMPDGTVAQSFQNGLKGRAEEKYDFLWQNAASTECY